MFGTRQSCVCSRGLWCGCLIVVSWLCLSPDLNCCLLDPGNRRFVFAVHVEVPWCFCFFAVLEQGSVHEYVVVLLAVFLLSGMLLCSGLVF